MGGKRLSSKKWLEIENEYVETDISYRDIAEKHKISFDTLQERAKIKNWTDKRRQYHDNITTENEKLKSAKAKKEAAELEKIRNEERADCEIMRRAVYGVMFTDAPNDQRKLNPTLEPKDVKSLAAALKNIQEMRYRSYGVADKTSIDATIDDKTTWRDNIERSAERTARILSGMAEFCKRKTDPD